MFRLEAKIFSREKRARSVVAAAAYREHKGIHEHRERRLKGYFFSF